MCSYMKSYPQTGMCTILSIKIKLKKKSVHRRKVIPKLGCALFWVKPLNFDHQRAKPRISRFRSVATNRPSFGKRHLSLSIQ